MSTAAPTRPRRGPQPKPDLTVKFAGLKFKNPIIAASGTFSYGVEFEDVVHLDKLGGFVVKGLSIEPMPGRLYGCAAYESFVSALLKRPYDGASTRKRYSSFTTSRSETETPRRTE